MIAKLRSSVWRLMRFDRASVRTQRGFTMIEMLLVVAVVIVIAAMAVPSFNAVQTYRGQNDARTIVGELMVARMRATADFARAKVTCTISTRTCQLQTQQNGFTTWTAETNGGVLVLSAGESFAIPAVAATGAGGQSSSLTQGSSAAAPAVLGTIEITFNSRGVPVNPSTGIIVPDYAIYLTDSANNSYAVAVDAGGRAGVYRLVGSTYTKMQD